jgi:hypothetical protein
LLTHWHVTILSANSSGIVSPRKARCNARHGHNQIPATRLGRPHQGGQDTGSACLQTGYSRRQPSAHASTAGLGWSEVECNRCKTRASIPFDAVRRPRDTPLWKLEASFNCRSCRKGRHAPPVHLIKLNAERAVALTKWFHPREEER